MVNFASLFKPPSLARGVPESAAQAEIRPSGTAHVGNYLGATKNWVANLDDYDCVFGTMDYHAITITYTQAGCSSAAMTPPASTSLVVLIQVAVLSLSRPTSFQYDVRVAPLTLEAIITMGPILQSHRRPMVGDP